MEYGCVRRMMKVLADRKIKALFCKIVVCILAFTLFSAVFIMLKTDNVIFYLFLCTLGMCITILGTCYRYFKEQDEIMENAVTKITEYISGNREARIPCDEEGEVYRLFHEINSLAAILNANAENERKSRRFLKNTISDISHQLKTPLAALNIYNGLMQEETEKIPEIQEFIMLSEKELDRIETLVQNLLKITKLDAGSIVFEKTSESVAGLMEEIELHFAYRAKEEEKKLLLSGNEKIYLTCDRNWMVEAMENLVKNAFDHTGRGDCIRIQWKQSASVIQIQIQDNGCGIHPEDLHHIFKRFYRSRFSKDTQGVGLGLPLAKGVIEEHNGTIEVDSELGAGTTFTVNFLIPTKL